MDHATGMDQAGARARRGLLSQNAYARRLGVAPSTVNRWLKAGRITAEANGLIDPERADRERDATESPFPMHQARKAQFDAERAARRLADDGQTPGGVDAPQAGVAMPPMEKLGAALKLETYKLQKAKAEQANLELDRSAGLLVERAAVDLVLADFGATLRGLLENLPGQLAPSLSGHRGDVTAIHAELESVTSDLLREMAAHMQRKLESMQ